MIKRVYRVSTSQLCSLLRQQLAAMMAVIQMSVCLCTLLTHFCCCRLCLCTLQDIVRDIADAVQSRSAEDRNFGTVLVPEGLIKAIPEMGTLLSEVYTYLILYKSYFIPYNTGQKTPRGIRSFCSHTIPERTQQHKTPGVFYSGCYTVYAVAHVTVSDASTAMCQIASSGNAHSVASAAAATANPSRRECCQCNASSYCRQLLVLVCT
jgi:hypothetical protein